MGALISNDYSPVRNIKDLTQSSGNIFFCNLIFQYKAIILSKTQLFQSNVQNYWNVSKLLRRCHIHT